MPKQSCKTRTLVEHKPKIADCKCILCKYYYAHYDCTHSITPITGPKTPSMYQQSYCTLHKLGLPLITVDVSAVIPNVKECGDFKKLK